MNVKNRTFFIADNLDIMRGIDSQTVDLIYLDPPFIRVNSGKHLSVHQQRGQNLRTSGRMRMLKMDGIEPATTLPHV